MTAAPLEITNLSKKFSGREVIRNISITLEKGEIFGLIGLNGAGKTTMIKSILGLQKPDSGEIKIFGRSSDDYKARKNLCYLPEKFTPSQNLKGYEFIKFASSFHGAKLANDNIAAKAKELDLNEEALSRRLGKYSKGMGQKVGLVSAMLSGAPLLMLDEPMSGLDPKARILLKRQMIAYRDAGNTIFFSSHILADLEEVCDRIAILHDSEIKFIGKPAEFMAQYKSANTLEKAFLELISA